MWLIFNFQLPFQAPVNLALAHEFLLPLPSFPTRILFVFINFSTELDDYRALMGIALFKRVFNFLQCFRYFQTLL